MSKIKWEREYNINIKEIDNQHKKLVELIDRLAEAIEKKTVKTKLENILDELVEYAIIHFDTEEKYFDKFNYKNAKEHKEKHQEFKDKINDFKKKIKNQEIEISFELIDFLENWLVDHLMDEDQKYIECFKKNGLK